MKLFRVLLRLLVVTIVVWGLLALFSRVLYFRELAPPPLPAFGCALAVELVVALSRYERGAVTRRRARWMLVLRLGSLALLVWVLLEPAWVRAVSRALEREVVIVLDESASMQLQDEGASGTRSELAEEALQKAGLVAKLAQNHRVRILRAARSLRGEEEAESAGWRESTDLAAALETVLEQVPPDEIGGVILVSDGRHNRPSRVEDVARRFGILDAPVASLAVGAVEPPRDAAILSVVAPDAIHLGDRMRVRADLKFDHYQGQKARVRLMRAGELLEEQEVSIPQQHHREEVIFSQVPEAGGLGDFAVEIEALGGERFSENNGWDFETTITDARTNVLLIDQHPRWEFRYLRNLFYGRDKSVHLQWLLLNPDRIGGQEIALAPASASRDFGDAQATALPASEEEWRKFDVIILGDLEASAMSEETWQIISRCVTERAALLILVAGSESMPHALGEAGRKLVPVEMEWGERSYFHQGGESFQIALGVAGKGHPVVAQARAGATDEQLWSSFPPMRWRHPLTSLKPGAEALLVAQTRVEAVGEGQQGLTDALQSLGERSQREAENALLVTQQQGRGKVALLLTDRTWRLREGSGDLYHHRFWGNLVRWGAGPLLRAGSEQVRLGSDQLTYTPDDVVLVQARLRAADLAPVWDESLAVELLSDGEVVARVKLAPVPDSNGLHSGVAGPFADLGSYDVRLVGERAAVLMQEEGLELVTTGFRVVGSLGPVELAETTLNLPLLQTIAELSGGKVVDLAEVEDLVALFSGEVEEREEVRETLLWNQWPVLLLLLACLASEWLLRRGGGLP